MTTTPNMAITEPDVSVTEGPAWATLLNSAFDRVDQHDHSSGNGVRITPAGLNINQDLPFGSSNATALKSTRFTSQSAVLAAINDKSCVYVVDGNLYYNNSSGTSIQLTSGSGINLSSIGTIGGDYGASGVTATVTYSNTTKAYSFLQAASQAAKLFTGDILLTSTAASTQSVTLKADPTVTAYSLTYPIAAPATDTISAWTSAGVGTFRTLTGTSNQLTVTPSSGAFTFSLPSAITAPGSLTTTSSLAVGTTLGVTGATSLASTLAVVGASTLAALSATTGSFSGAVDVTGIISTPATLQVRRVAGPLVYNEISYGSSDRFLFNQTNGGTYDFQVSGVSRMTLSAVGLLTPAALTVTGATTLSSTLAVAGAITNNGIAVPTISSTSTLTNKSLVDASTFIIHTTDSAKRVLLDVGSIATATTKTWSFPDQSDIFVGLTVPQTLTNKTLTSPVISGGSINNATIGATTRSTGAFTTLAANGAATLTSTLDVTDTATFASTIISNSRVRNGDGTGLVPSYSFSSSNTTGIYLPSATFMRFISSGAAVSEFDFASYNNVMSRLAFTTAVGTTPVTRGYVGVAVSTNDTITGATASDLFYRSGNGHIWGTGITKLMTLSSAGWLDAGTTSGDATHKFRSGGTTDVDIIGSAKTYTFQSRSDGDFRLNDSNLGLTRFSVNGSTGAIAIGTNGNTAICSVNAGAMRIVGAAASSSPYLELSGSGGPFIAYVGTAGVHITGSAVADLALVAASGKNIIFSANYGSTMHGKIDTNGVLSMSAGIATGGNGSGHAIKWKTFTGSIGATTYGTLAHGLTSSSIISITGVWNVTSDYSGDGYPIGLAADAGLSVRFETGANNSAFDSTNIKLRNDAGSIRYFKILVQYQ